MAFPKERAEEYLAWMKRREEEELLALIEEMDYEHEADAEAYAEAYAQEEMDREREVELQCEAAGRNAVHK
jgi:hypothetical protein